MLKVNLPVVKHAIKDLIYSWQWPQRPQTLNFEITAACDAKCIHCPRQEMDRPVKAMKMELFHKLIDEAAEMGIPELCPNGYGEILTLPNMEEYLDYVSARHPKAVLLINTNGHRMTDDKIELFFRHRVKMLNIMIDGATPETAQSVRVNLKTERIEDNIHRLLAQRKARGLKYPMVRVGMVLLPQNTHEVDLFLEKWTGVADSVGCSPFSSFLGGVQTDNWKAGQLDAVSAPRAEACVLPFRELNIFSDGKAVLCCNDWNESYVVGDLNTQHLRAIWHSPEMEKARRLHAHKRGHQLEVCARCNNWAPPGRLAKLWV